MNSYMLLFTIAVISKKYEIQVRDRARERLFGVHTSIFKSDSPSCMNIYNSLIIIMSHDDRKKRNAWNCIPKMAYHKYLRPLPQHPPTQTHEHTHTNKKHVCILYVCKLYSIYVLSFITLGTILIACVLTKCLKKIFTSFLQFLNYDFIY